MSLTRASSPLVALFVLTQARNPLLEQMIPMPPSTYRKGRATLAREATFDPLRGAFVVLARPDEPDPVARDRRTGLRVGQHKDVSHDVVIAVIVRNGQSLIAR